MVFSFNFLIHSQYSPEAEECHWCRKKGDVKYRECNEYSSEAPSQLNLLFVKDTNGKTVAKEADKDGDGSDNHFHDVCKSPLHLADDPPVMEWPDVNSTPKKPIYKIFCMYLGKVFFDSASIWPL